MQGNHSRRGCSILCLVTALLLGVVAAGCAAQVSTTTNDSKALEKEGEKLRKQHEREMSNK